MARLIVAVVSLVSAVLASTAAAQVGDSVTGSGSHSGFGRFDSYSFVIDAHSGPSGESATGTASLSPAFFGPFTGPVTCLSVTGNTGTLNFVVVNPANPLDRHVFTFSVTDSPAGDLIAQRFDVRADTDCTPLPSSGDAVTSGDIVVFDAPPLPTTTDQCKNDGWRTYGVFKNQGDCVSFVATGGKNPPANSP